MEEDPLIRIRVAVPADVKYVYAILEEMERSARQRGTGISRRTPQYICQRIYSGEAIIALTEGGDWLGFSYIAAWSAGAFVSNGGLIVCPSYRHAGIARRIKESVFQLSTSLYPGAKIFSITTGAAVMSLNHELGFRPVTYDDITGDNVFWEQCKACINYPILHAQGRKRCLCTALLFDPAKDEVDGKSHGKDGVEARSEVRDKSRRNVKGNENCDVPLSGMSLVKTGGDAGVNKMKDIPYQFEKAFSN